MKQFLCMLLCLALMLGVCAQAQEIPEYNQLTVTMDGIGLEEFTGKHTSIFQPLRIKVRIGLGADFDAARALASLAVVNDKTDKGVSVVGALENETVKLRVDGMRSDISFSTSDLMNALLSGLLPPDMTLEEAPIEFQQALSDVQSNFVKLLNIVYSEKIPLSPYAAISLGDADIKLPLPNSQGLVPTEEEWLASLDAYTQRPNVVPVGEEEITLLGESRPAMKYTFTQEVYEVNNLWDLPAETLSDPELQQLAADIQDSIERLRTESYKLIYGTDFAPDQTSGIPISIPEMQGTVYIAKDGSALLKSYAFSVEGESNPYQTVTEEITSYADGTVRTESTSRSGNYTFRSVEQITEHEDGSIEMYQENGTLYSYTFEGDVTDLREENTTVTAQFGSDLLSIDIMQSARQENETLGNYENNVHSRLEMTKERSDRWTGGFFVKVKDNEISPLLLTANLTVDFSFLPEGDLISLSDNLFNPFTADSEEENAMMEELSTVLTNAVFSLFFPPEAAPGVGGALIGGK